MPEPDPLRGNLLAKCHEVTLDKEPSGFGFTARGGMLLSKMKSYPLLVMAIRRGGPADRDGRIKVGDRIMAINGYKLTHLSLSETQIVMRQCDVTASFSVTYDTAIMESIERASGPVFLEIEHSPGSDFGITLTSVMYEGKSCLGVDFVQPMSIADRSGALHQGDYILSINGVLVESMTVPEASQLLKSSPEASVQLEIIPASHLQLCASRQLLVQNAHPLTKQGIYANVNGPSEISNGSLDLRQAGTDRDSIGISQFGTLNMRNKGIWSNGAGRKATSSLSIASSAGTSLLSATNQVCHTETMEVILFSDHRGLGITLIGAVFPSAPLSQPPTIAYIEPRSAAERCGVLQEGDRVLAIDGLETAERSLDELHHFLYNPRSRCVLLIEFDIAESVVLSSGTYVVKLAKKCADTGITVNASKSSKPHQDVLYISDVRRGSVAHRMGSVQAGDKLLAVNDVRLDSCTCEDAMHLLELPDEIVKLKLRRDDPDEGHEGCIIYTVELQRFGGALGITISGTEDPHDPIVISELTPQGLAERTGAIHVGDWLLAVSGDTTKNKPLSEVIRMLQSADDLVTLKIARPEQPGNSGLPTHSTSNLAKPIHSAGSPLPSLDSAMDSWDSSAVDVADDSRGGQCKSKKEFGSQHLHLHLPGSNDSNVIDLAVPQAEKLPDRLAHHYQGQNQLGHPVNMEDVNQSYRENDGISSQTDSDALYDDDDSDRSSDDGRQMKEWMKTLEEFDTESGSEMLRQIGLSLRQRSTLNLDHSHNDQHVSGISPRSSSKSDCELNRDSDEVLHKQFKKLSTDLYTLPKKTVNTANRDDYATPSKHKSTTLPNIPARPLAKSSLLKDKGQVKTIFTPNPIQFQRCVLRKQKSEEDFGFSLSDGLYESGVYISAVRKGSMAHVAGLRVYDKILQVNKKKVNDLDCSHTVPLIAEEGKKLDVIVCRNPLLRLSHSLRQEPINDNYNDHSRRKNT